MDLVLDCANPPNLVDFWREALDYREYYTDSSVAVVVPKDGNAPPLVLQRVPEPKAGKNRMHLDIVVGDMKWVRMADPEHNEFCVCSGVEW